MAETRVILSFIFVSFYITPVFMSEESKGSCSKFSCEYDMLSKMVRMEAKMEQMETEMVNQRKQMEKFSKGYTSMRDILFVVMENKTAEIAQAMEGLNTSEKARSIVAFSAAAQEHSTITGEYKPFVFDSVVTNIGNAYDYISGQFVAPVSGIYVFYSSILSANGLTFHADFSVNGHTKVRFHESGKNGQAYGMASQSLIVELLAGDVVTVNNRESIGKAYGGTYSTFSGFLFH